MRNKQRHWLQSSWTPVEVDRFEVGLGYRLGWVPEKQLGLQTAQQQSPQLSMQLGLLLDCPLPLDQPCSLPMGVPQLQHQYHQKVQTLQSDLMTPSTHCPNHLYQELVRHPNCLKDVTLIIIVFITIQKTEHGPHSIFYGESKNLMYILSNYCSRNAQIL